MTQLPSNRREESEQMILLITLFQIITRLNECWGWPTWSLLSWSRLSRWHIRWFHWAQSSREFDACSRPDLLHRPTRPELKWTYFRYSIFPGILYFFRYYSASGAWLAHLQGREPRGQIRLIRSIRWCWWDRRQPAREGAARPSPSVQRTLSSRHQGKSLDTDDSERLKSKWKHLKTKWVKRELFPFFSDTHVFETNLQCCNIFHCHLWRGGKDNI